MDPLDLIFTWEYPNCLFTWVFLIFRKWIKSSVVSLFKNKQKLIVTIFPGLGLNGISWERIRRLLGVLLFYL